MKLGALSAYFFFFLESFQWHSHWGVQKYCQKSAKRGKSGRKDQNWDGSFTLPLLTNTKNRAGYATGLHHARNLSTLERWKCRRSHVMSHVSGGINSKILLACPKKIWAKVCFFGFSKKKITFGEIRLLNLTSMHGMIHHISLLHAWTIIYKCMDQQCLEAFGCYLKFNPLHCNILGPDIG